MENLQREAVKRDNDEPFEKLRAYTKEVLRAKTLKNMRAWEKALKRLKDTRTGNRLATTTTFNDDRTHGIEPIVANFPLSTINRYAAVLRFIV